MARKVNLIPLQCFHCPWDIIPTPDKIFHQLQLLHSSFSSTLFFHAIPPLEAEQLSPGWLWGAVGQEGQAAPALQPCSASSHSTNLLFPWHRACLELHKVLLFLQTIKCVFWREFMLSRIPAVNRIFTGCKLKTYLQKITVWLLHSNYSDSSPVFSQSDTKYTRVQDLL